MTPKTKRALQESIVHWEDNLNLAKKRLLTREDISSYSCPLCRVFEDESGCKGCPVSEKTGCGNCRYTPWYAVSEALSSLDYGPLKLAVQAELDFLKSLSEVDPLTSGH